MLDAIVISDVHLGSSNSRACVLNKFLESIIKGRIYTKKLILNGDIFDSIDFRRLKSKHWKVLSNIRLISQKTDVIWITGNHDSSCESISHLIGVQVFNDYIFESGNKKIFVTHGDKYDNFIDKHPFLTFIGDVIYNFLQFLDKKHTIARIAKINSKMFLRCSDKVQEGATEEAKIRGCNVAICGHTHLARECDGEIKYYNSGCWTEYPSSYISIKDGLISIKNVSGLAS